MLETEVKYAAIAKGLDVDFGILHADRSNRTSLVYDLMEPLRAKVDRLLLDWFIIKKFNPKDFFETREGVCRISQDIAKEIIPLINELDRDIASVIKEFGRFFKDKTVIAVPVGVHKYRPDVVMRKKTCPACNEEFIPTRPGQLYCSDKHKNRHHAKLIREKRTLEGLCPQCGKPMPEPRIGVRGKRVSYCESCAEYYRGRSKRSLKY